MKDKKNNPAIQTKWTTFYCKHLQTELKLKDKQYKIADFIFRTSHNKRFSFIKDGKTWCRTSSSGIQSLMGLARSSARDNLRKLREQGIIEYLQVHKRLSYYRIADKYVALFKSCINYADKKLEETATCTQCGNCKMPTNKDKVAQKAPESRPPNESKEPNINNNTTKAGSSMPLRAKFKKLIREIQIDRYFDFNKVHRCLMRLFDYCNENISYDWLRIMARDRLSKIKAGGNALGTMADEIYLAFDGIIDEYANIKI